jgi:hypothetical protein
MGGDNAEKYQGFEAGFRLHVSATYAAVKVRQCPDMLTAISAWVNEAGFRAARPAAAEAAQQELLCRTTTAAAVTVLCCICVRALGCAGSSPVLHVRQLRKYTEAGHPSIADTLWVVSGRTQSEQLHAHVRAGSRGRAGHKQGSCHQRLQRRGHRCIAVPCQDPLLCCEGITGALHIHIMCMCASKQVSKCSRQQTAAPMHMAAGTVCAALWLMHAARSGACLADESRLCSAASAGRSDPQPGPPVRASIRACHWRQPRLGQD